jgi:nitroreductase
MADSQSTHPVGVAEAIRKRHSTRAFLDREVDYHIIRRILDTARFAPSGVNMQPWKVAIVTGTTRKILEQRMLEEFVRGNHGKMDYDYYPGKFFSPYKERRREVAKIIYQALRIGMDEEGKRRDQWARNYSAFGAPVMLFFFMDPGLGTGSFLDYGTFIQNIMLLAIEEGLATCPQGALGEYPQIVKQTLGYPEDSILLSGMALGYEDPDHPANRIRIPRCEVEDFTTCHG